MAPYAQRTGVPVDRSRAEIEHNLDRFGAEGFGYRRVPGLETLEFSYQGKVVLLRMGMPVPDDPPERRRRWRVMSMTVKALLVAVDEGLITFEEAFLAHFQVGPGRTVGDELVPELDRAVAERRLPTMLPMLPAGHNG